MKASCWKDLQKAENQARRNGKFCLPFRARCDRYSRLVNHFATFYIHDGDGEVTYRFQRIEKMRNRTAAKIRRLRK